ncbi:hypothetical protein MMC29_002149 [Sticta canariensis]|nr:hypothetical protein [Sticta canariensis]
MPRRIEKHDESSQERLCKRRRVSVEPDKADSFKRQRLNDLNLRNCPHISRDERYKAWLINAGKPLRSNNVSQLPSPDVTTQSFSRAPTSVSVKSTASVHDIDYREKLAKHNIYVPGEDPPPGFKEKVESMVFRLRETPELDDAAISPLRETMKDLQNKGEEEVKSKLGAKIIPGYDTPSDKRLEVVHGQLWNKAVPIPHDSTLLVPPLPLPKPKPDTTFAFSKTAFDRYQLGTMSSLVTEPNGPSFASPNQDLRFPYLVIEYKSQAKGGSIRVATNQAVGAGAVALNGLRETISCGLGLDPSDIDTIMVFSVTMDQNSACINVEWIGKPPDTNEYTYHLEELKMLSLRYDDSVQVLQRALKNIHGWAAEDLLKLLVNALNEYRNKDEKKKNADPVEKPQVEKELHAPPSPPKPPRSKRARGLKAHKETTELHTQSKQDTQTQAETQPVGVRTRRKARLEKKSFDLILI